LTTSRRATKRSCFLFECLFILGPDKDYSDFIFHVLFLSASKQVPGHNSSFPRPFELVIRNYASVGHYTLRSWECFLE